MIGVYAIVHIASGKTYVGSSKNIETRLKGHQRRLNKGNHPNQKLQRAWAKYGERAFLFRVLEICGELDRLSKEQAYIDGLETCDKGYNICRVAGATTGYKHTAEAKAKIAKASRGNQYLLGKKQSAEAIARRAASNTGKTLSEATKAKISQAHRGKRQAPEHLAKLSQARKGRTLSDEHKVKIGAAGTGRAHSAESKAKISAANKGRQLSEDHKEAVRRARTGVKQSEETKAKRAASRALYFARKAATP